MITKYVTCIKIEISKDNILYFNDTDENIIIDGKKYNAGSSFMPNSIINSNELANDNFSLSGSVNHNTITQEAILSGDFANAYVELFIVDLLDLLKVKKILKSGWVGKIKLSNGKFIMDINSISHKTNSLIGRIY